MQVVACCAHQWRVSTRVVLFSAGVFCKLHTSPPVTGETFPYNDLVLADLVYLSLHGLAKEPYLYGDGLITAFEAAKVPKLLKSPVVVMEGCEGGSTPIPGIFIEQGACVVLADRDESTGRVLTPGPSGKIGRDFVRLMRKGYSAEDALKQAKLGKKETGYDLVGNKKAKLLDGGENERK